MVLGQSSCSTKPKMPISAASQSGQLPGQEPARHGPHFWRGGGLQVAEAHVATCGVIPLQTENFRFQALSDNIYQ